jgi:hypothetical protein
VKKLGASAAFGAVAFDNGDARDGSLTGSEERLGSFSFGSPQKKAAAAAARKLHGVRAFSDAMTFGQPASSPRAGSLRASSAGTSDEPAAAADAFQRAPTLRPVGGNRLRSQSSSRSSSFGSRGSSSDVGRTSANSERAPPARTAASTGHDAALDALRKKAVAARVQSLGRSLTTVNATSAFASALKVEEDEFEAAEAEFALHAEQEAKLAQKERDLEANAEYLAAEEEFRRHREWQQAEAQFAHEDEFQKAEREFKERARAEKQLASHIDDALASDCTNVATIEDLLDRAQRFKLRHPALASLRQKLRKLQGDAHQTESALPGVEDASPEKPSAATAVEAQPRDGRDGETEVDLNGDAAAVITLECPEGMGPGDVIHVDWRGGEIEIEIPVGVSAGDEFEVEVEVETDSLVPGDSEAGETNGRILGNAEEHNPDEDEAEKISEVQVAAETVAEEAASYPVLGPNDGSITAKTERGSSVSSEENEFDDDDWDDARAGDVVTASRDSYERRHRAAMADLARGDRMEEKNTEPEDAFGHQQSTDNVSSNDDQNIATDIESPVVQMVSDEHLTDVVQAASANASDEIPAAQVDSAPQWTDGAAEPEQRDRDGSDASDASTVVSEQTGSDHEDGEQPVQAPQIAHSVRGEQHQDCVDETASAAALDQKYFPADDLSAHPSPRSTELLASSKTTRGVATTSLSQQPGVRCYSCQRASYIF